MLGTMHEIEGDEKAQGLYFYSDKQHALQGFFGIWYINLSDLILWLNTFVLIAYEFLHASPFTLSFSTFF